MTEKEIKDLLEAKEYSFLKTNTYLGDNICLLTLGGSRAYGTNLPSSDTDIRGVALNPFNQIYGLSNDFEQIVETTTDTTVYSLNKMVKLLISCNPNTIEMLGCREEDYLYTNEYGKLLLDNKNNFLSIKAIDTFGGYARAQFNRLEHALLGNGEIDDKKLEMLRHSLECSVEAFNLKHSTDKINLRISILSEEETKEFLKDKFAKDKATLKAELDKAIAETTDASKLQSLMALYDNDIERLEKDYQYKLDNPNDNIDDRIIITGNIDEMPVDLLQSLLRSIHKIKSDYGNINKRNTKKDEIHLAKHMMHLIRLYMMGIKLNESMDIHTHWDGKELELLMSIRNMQYMTADGKNVRPEFYELLQDIEKKYDYSTKNTVLPKEPNYMAINQMIHEIYSKKYN